MMPGLLTKLGLCEALEDLFEQLDESEGVTATCEIIGAHERLPENQEIMIYRIVQEMVNNTLKHAEANNINLNIDVLPGKLEIRYSDNGKGFNVEETLAKKSIGLQSIKSRVKFLDGSVSIESGVGKGTVYALQIPVTRDL
jgi:signal transduction histidine kinase